MIDTLAELVRIPSVVGNEQTAQAFMQKQYERLGLDVRTFEADKEKVGQHSAYVESGLGFEERPNVIGVLKGDPHKKSLILNGHVDVVSPEPVDQWQHDPWGAEIEDKLLVVGRICNPVCQLGALATHYPPRDRGRSRRRRGDPSLFYGRLHGRRHDYSRTVYDAGDQPSRHIVFQGKNQRPYRPCRPRA